MLYLVLVSIAPFQGST